MAHIGTQVNHYVFHDECAVVTGIAAARTQNVQTVLGHPTRHRQQLKRGRGVHIDQQRLRVAAPRCVADTFQVYGAQGPRKTIHRLETGFFRKLDVNPLCVGLKLLMCFHAATFAEARVAFSRVQASSAGRASRLN